MNKQITILTIFILTLTGIYGCQQKTETEKVIYEIPISAHLMELEHQEIAYRDSLRKYSTLGNKAQSEYYHVLYKNILDSCSILLKQEAEAFMIRQKGNFDTKNFNDK